ncbi:MAG: hypothetical protein EOP49_26470 [Sphingobacteriales bacterium]|nr:MAG: hypothetical protein EOP49_26470 [Sphingobacteriales bacterium]
MKRLALSILAFLFVTQVSAQSPLPKGSKQLNAGVGLSGWGVPIYVGMDFGVHPDISVGGELSFRSYKRKYFGETYKHNITGLAANANYHFNRVLSIPSNWDLYAGLNLGFYLWNSSDDFDGDDESGLNLGAQVGGRYYFTPKFGVNLEFGGGNAFSGGKLGISVKL